MASSSEREQNIFRAKLADIAKRHDDMFEAIKKVAKMDAAAGLITEDVRDLLSVAFKNVVGSRRSSWRILSEFVKESRNEKVNAEWVKEYMEMVQIEITKICNDIRSIISDSISPKTSVESTVFFYKMRGDCWRYLAEIKTGDDRETSANNSLLAYEMATHFAKESLCVTDPIRLSLALNYSLLHYEIFNTTDSISEAYNIAKNAFDQVNENGPYQQNIDLTMDLLMHNLALWEKVAGVKAANKAGGKGAE